MVEFKFESEFRMEWECYWVKSETRKQWVWSSRCANGWIQDGSIQDGCHHQVQSEWISEVFLCRWWELDLGKSEWVCEDKLRWLNPRWPAFKMAVFKMPCYHLVRWEWMSLSQIELVCVRVRVEWECFWVNLREDNKVSESKMTVFESNRAEF